MPEITLKINGESQSVAEGTQLLELLDGLNLPSSGIAVAIDQRIIPRREYDGLTLVDGSTIEIVRAVGGG